MGVGTDIGSNIHSLRSRRAGAPNVECVSHAIGCRQSSRTVAYTTQGVPQAALVEYTTDCVIAGQHGCELFQSDSASCRPSQCLVSDAVMSPA